jgi:hypothetical protein
MLPLAVAKATAFAQSLAIPGRHSASVVRWWNRTHPGMTPRESSARIGFFELVRQIVRSHPEGITPQEIRDTIKAD